MIASGGYEDDGPRHLTLYNAVVRRIRPTAVAITVLVAIGLLVIAFRNSGRFLVVDNRQKSDAILITQGDSLDASYWLGLRLLKDGYGRVLFLDARTDRMFFGRSQAQLAAEFITKTAANLPGQVRVCPIKSDTTADEVYEAGNCLSGNTSVLLLVSDFHSRRSLEIFSRLLPHYHWSIAPVEDPLRFGDHWWRRREWIRTALVEWQHLLWWELVDRWRFAPSTGQTPI